MGPWWFLIAAIALASVRGRDRWAGVAVLVVVGSWFVVGVRRWLIRRRLLGAGPAVEARVVGIVHGWGHSWRGGFSMWAWAIEYEYRDHLGETHEARSGPISTADVLRWKVGDACAVRFDRDRPDRSVWLGRTAA